MASTILLPAVLIFGVVGLIIIAVGRHATQPMRHGHHSGIRDGGAAVIYGGDSDCSPADSSCDGGGGDGGIGGGGD